METATIVVTTNTGKIQERRWWLSTWTLPCASRSFGEGGRVSSSAVLSELAAVSAESLPEAEVDTMVPVQGGGRKDEYFVGWQFSEISTTEQSQKDSLSAPTHCQFMACSSVGHASIGRTKSSKKVHSLKSHCTSFRQQIQRTSRSKEKTFKPKSLSVL